MQNVKISPVYQHVDHPLEHPLEHPLDNGQHWKQHVRIQKKNA